MGFFKILMGFFEIKKDPQLKVYFENLIIKIVSEKNIKI